VWTTCPRLLCSFCPEYDLNPRQVHRCTRCTTVPPLFILITADETWHLVSNSLFLVCAVLSLWCVGKTYMEYWIGRELEPGSWSSIILMPTLFCMYVCMGEFVSLWTGQISSLSHVVMNHVLDWGQDRTNPFAATRGWQDGDSAFCQVTLDTCSSYLVGMALYISDIAIFVLKKDVKLPTN